jgi:Flp pilus assembly protein TadG
MSMLDQNLERGSTVIEFTLVGIPLIFVLISIFEISRAMWVYTTMAHALKEGMRFAVVHGNNCYVTPNSCGRTVRDIAVQIREQGVGLIPADLQNVRFITTTGTVTCATLQSCLDAGDPGDRTWPSSAPNDVGANPGAPVEIRGVYRFPSALAMFWPGAGPGFTFGTLGLPASSRERVQY